MTLRDVNLRYAALKLIADIVDKAMKDEKAQHLDQLEESAEDTGSSKWNVTLEGEKVATITLSQRAGGLKIFDEDALIEHLEQSRPDMLETITRIRPWAAKEILATVTMTEAGAVNTDGEVIPGIVETEPGSPYQTLRWDAKNDGRDRLTDAIRAGELRDLLDAAGLPLIGGPQ